jgi:hypothetical protein
MTSWPKECENIDFEGQKLEKGIQSERLNADILKKSFGQPDF